MEAVTALRAEYAPMLTEREQRVLIMLADGLDTEEIMAELHYAERTVKNIVHDLMLKLVARNRAHAVANAVRYGWLTLDVPVLLAAKKRIENLEAEIEKQRDQMNRAAELLRRR